MSCLHQPHSESTDAGSHSAPQTDQLCIRCEILQCTVLGKHGAVSDDVTLRGRDVIFFLKQAKIIPRCRFVPGMPRPGVSK